VRTEPERWRVAGWERLFRRLVHLGVARARLGCRLGTAVGLPAFPRRRGCASGGGSPGELLHGSTLPIVRRRHSSHRVALVASARLAGPVRIVIASDHAGFPLKEVLVDHLRTAGHDVRDLGTHSTDPVDYPPLCAAAARAVARGEADTGVVLGGSGQGEAIAANKVHGIRAALCHDETTARLARQHNDANVLSMGARLVAPTLAIIILDVFLRTAFEGGRHVARLRQIAAIEAEECSGTGSGDATRPDRPSAETGG